MLCHNYIFFDSAPSIISIKNSDLKKYKADFAKVVIDAERHGRVSIRTYSTLGLKSRTRFMLWCAAETPEEVQDFLIELLHTKLGRHLVITHTLFGLVRPSHYTSERAAATQAITDEQESDSKYLVVYPFTKTKEWYLLPEERRRELMTEHIRVGRKFGPIRQKLLYGYGVDDYEFILSYMTDNLIDFQSLVVVLRGTEARLYTEVDTPIFTCIRKSIQGALTTI